MAYVRRSKTYKIEEHFFVDDCHHLIRCAHNRHHWWHHGDGYPAWITEMVMDDFGTLVPVSA